MGCRKLTYNPDKSPLFISKGVENARKSVQGFISADPLKDEYPYYTSYQYAGNKPVTFIDLDGLEEATPKLLMTPALKELQKLAFEKPETYDPNRQGQIKSDKTQVNSLNEKKAFIQGQVDKQQDFEQFKSDLASGKASFQDTPNKESVRASSTQHPGVGTDLQRLAESPVIRGYSLGLLGGVAATAVSETAAYETVASNPYVQRFVFDAVTQQAAKTVDRFVETGTVSFQADDIDLANAFFKAVLGGKFGDSNKTFKTLKPFIEESLKTLVDFNAEAGLEDLKPVNELLAEFGLRLAFKAIPTNSKDVFGEKEFGTGTEFVLEVTKKAVRGEAKEEIMKMDKNIQRNQN